MESQRWNLVVDGNVEESFDNFSTAYDALEAYVGGDDFTDLVSCDGNKIYGFPTQEDANAAEGTECSYVPYICEVAQD